MQWWGLVVQQDGRGQWPAMPLSPSQHHRNGNRCQWRAVHPSTQRSVPGHCLLLFASLSALQVCSGTIHHNTKVQRRDVGVLADPQDPLLRR
jgi:hypothetical protein